MNLKEANSLDANNKNAAIANEQRSFKGLDASMLFRCDVEKTAIAEKRNNVLKSECDEEGSTTNF